MSELERRTRFEEMFRATYERVLAYTLRRADRADAEDVVADTYAVAWRRLDDIPSDPLPWLYGVARRTLANSRRGVRRRAQLAQRLVGEVSTVRGTAADPSEQLEDLALMRAALASLDEQDRELLMLVAWEGLDNEQAAAALGISSPTLAVRVHRARKRLAAAIERRSHPAASDEGPEGEP